MQQVLIVLQGSSVLGTVVVLHDLAHGLQLLHHQAGIPFIIYTLP